MLQILNIGPNLVSLSSSYIGGQGRPLYIKLAPREQSSMTQAELANWPVGAKENLASYVQASQLQVNEMNSYHVVSDVSPMPPLELGKVNPPQVYPNSKTPSAGETEVDGYIKLAVSLRDAYNVHCASGVHTAPDTVNNMTAADPTDAATLYSFLTTFKTKYNTHIAATAPPHVISDTTTTLVSPNPTTLATSADLMVEIHKALSVHKILWQDGSKSLTPNEIIAYT